MLYLWMFINLKREKMIDIYKLTRRHVDVMPEEMPKQLKQVKVFSLAVGHSVGTIDFVECIETMKEEDYFTYISHCGPYVQFKLGNLSRYFEIEVFPEHVLKLKDELCEGRLKEILLALDEGYIVIRKQR